jgi:hypothetical protein
MSQHFPLSEAPALSFGCTTNCSLSRRVHKQNHLFYFTNRIALNPKPNSVDNHRLNFYPSPSSTSIFFGDKIVNSYDLENLVKMAVFKKIQKMHTATTFMARLNVIIHNHIHLLKAIVVFTILPKNRWTNHLYDNMII